MEDTEAYIKYPKHRKWFNKLWLTEKFGYSCGPAGVTIPKTGQYIIRPIYNLAGMGAGAYKKKLCVGDFTSVPPGYFWCEYFEGKHYSANYQWEKNNITGGKWKGISCWEGINTSRDLTKFTSWNKVDHIPIIDRQDLFKELSDVNIINIEWKDNKIIEVHLRPSPDPDYNTLIPVWASDVGPKKQRYESQGFEWIESYDNAFGYIDNPRIGFFVK